MISYKKKSDLILEIIKKRKDKENIVDVDEEKVKLVIFSLVGNCYAFYGSDVKEILPLVNIFYVPGSPDFILGVINVRGDIESVITINKFLGLPGSIKTNHSSRILICAREELRSGILVDSIEDVLDVAISTIKPPISTLNKSIKECVSGETIYGDRNVTLLDINMIFEKIVI